MFTSIKVKIIAIISTFFAVVLFFNMLYSLGESKEQLSKYLKNLNSSSANLLEKNIRGDLYNLNYQNIKNTIDSFENDYFKNIYILNKEGFIFAQKTKDKIVYKKYSNFDKLLASQIEKKFLYLKPIHVLEHTIGYIVIENNNKIFEEIKEQKRDEIFRFFSILLVITILISYFISMIITEPIDKIIENIKKLNENKDFNFEHSNDEYGYLSKEIEKNHKNIQNLNNNLEKLVQEEIEKNRDKDKLLQEQSLQASMGRMMDAVAHQWMQPLGIIKLISQDLQLKAEFNTLENEDIEQASKNTSKQIEHMKETLNEFRSFFRDNKQTQEVVLEDIINSTLTLMKNALIKNSIEVKVESNSKHKVHLIPNEFKHVLINIINNSKDAFKSKDIKNREIYIKVLEKNNHLKLLIEDNAGGIEENIIENIFDINISSKLEDNGTGIGLYLTKMILHKIEAKIEAQNTLNGCCFTISLNSH